MRIARFFASGAAIAAIAACTYSTGDSTSSVSVNQGAISPQGGAGLGHRLYGWNRMWTPLAGRIVGDAALSSSSTNHMHLFGRGLDDHLYRWEWNATTNSWSAYSLVDATHTMSSSPASVGYNGNIEIFARGNGATYGQLLHWTCFSDPTTACTFRNEGGLMDGKPAVAADSTGLHAFVAGWNSTNLYHWGDTISALSPNGGFQSLARTFKGYGSAAAWHGHISLIATDGQGNAQELRWDETSLFIGQWTSIAGTLNDAPSVTAQDNGLVVFGRGGDDAIWSTTMSAGAWTKQWSRMDACTRGAAAVLAASDGDSTRLDTVIVAKDNTIVANRFTTSPDTSVDPDAGAGATASCCGPAYGNCCSGDPNPGCTAGDALDPATFGYASTPVSGTRPLLVILANDPTSTLPFQPTSHYDALVFGKLGGAASGAQNTLSYFAEVANGQFAFTRAGIVTVNGSFLGSPLPKLHGDALQAAASQINFANFDRNRDGIITSDELATLVIDNGSTDGGQTGGLDVVRCFPGQGVCTDPSLQVSGVGNAPSFTAINHELTHSLGTGLDMYGWPGVPNLTFAGNLSLMGQSEGDNGTQSYYPDAWLRMKYGWVMPRVRDLRVAGGETLEAPQASYASGTTNDRPVLLYDSRNGTREFFLVEYRTRSGGDYGGYDKDVSSNGIAIWQIQLDSNKQPYQVPAEANSSFNVWTVWNRAAPSWIQGLGGPLYNEGNGAIPLKLANGTNTGVNLHAGTATNLGNWLPISWQ